MRSIVFFSFSVLILLRFNGCSSKKTVLFVYNTRTINITEYETQTFNSEVEKVANQLFEEGLDLNFTIVYPHESFIEEIKAKDGKKRLNSSSQTVGYTGEQSILQNLRTWLQESPFNSVIYMVTNVLDHSDKNLVFEILETIQIKRIEVNFVLLDESFQNYDLEDYKLISFVSNGLIRFSLFGFKQLVYDGLKFGAQKVTILSADGTGRDFYYIGLDSLVTECIFICESFEGYRIYHREIIINYSKKQFADWVWWDYVRSTRKVSREALQKPLFHSLRGFARSYFNFHYGFSTDFASSLNETYMRPIKGKTNRIYISSNNETFEGRFSSFEITFRNGTSWGEYDLLQVQQDTDLYEGYFELPNEEYFYIKVKAYVNNATVFRMSSNAISAANGFGEDENNPAFSGSRARSNKLSWKIFQFIVVLVGLTILCYQIVSSYNAYYKDSPNPSLTELEKSHCRAVQNSYYPAVYNALQQNIAISSK